MHLNFYYENIVAYSGIFCYSMKNEMNLFDHLKTVARPKKCKAEVHELLGHSARGGAVFGPPITLQFAWIKQRRRKWRKNLKEKSLALFILFQHRL